MALDFKPRKWQEDALQFTLSGAPRYTLAMEMGSGKTTVVLSTLNCLQLMDEDVFPAIVFAPINVVKSVWAQECQKWNQFKHISCSPVVGSQDDRIFALRRKADIYAINYENIPWLMKYLNGVWPFKTVICDESSNLKSFRTRQGGVRAKAISKVRDITPSWINLDGTPAPNGLTDLWGPQFFIDGGEALGGSYSAYIDRWFNKVGDMQKPIPCKWAFNEITSLLKPTMRSIRMESYLPLDKPVVQYVKVSLPPVARRAYDTMEKELFMEVMSGQVNATNAGDRINKCLQICNGAVYSTKPKFIEIHDEKVEALKSIIEESKGDPIIVVYKFVHDKDRILKAIPGAVWGNGSIKILDLWNAGQIPVLVVHPLSYGHGLNLQHGGRRMAFFGMGNNAGAHAQILERIGPLRQFQAGLNRLVYTYYIEAEDTCDEDAREALEGKISLMQAILKRMERLR